METIYNIYEGLLKGQDATLETGDDLLKKAKSELSTIKTYTDHSNHSLWQSSKYGWEGRRYNEGFEAKALAAVLGYWDKIDTLRIIVTKDGDNGQWIIDLTFYDSGYRLASFDSKNWSMATIKYPVSNVKTFPTLLKKYVAPIFDSIESLKKFMNDNKVR
jgi:hypothetical protein